MSLLEALGKPWFVFRPQQLVLRALANFQRKPGFRPLPTVWGASLLADPTKTIGWSILSTGLYDLAVSELLVRLIAPGSTVIDAGANIGCMATLAATCTGSKGKVHAFEPHPALFAILQKNVQRNGLATQTSARQQALGAATGKLDLMIPKAESWNDGMAFIKGSPQARPASHSVLVAVTTIDELLGEQTAEVMKVDVEGYELQVLQGAAKALATKRIHHIVFEDHIGVGSPIMALLLESGYQIYTLHWMLTSLHLEPLTAAQAPQRNWEAPNFVATCRPEALLQAVAKPGWRVLRKLKI